MQLIKDIIERSVSRNNDIAIFDVDRTIINTTSWYHACMTEDLLLSKENINKFKSLNDYAFNNPTDQIMKDFRINTLNLMKKNIDNNYIQKIKSISNYNFKVGDYTNTWSLYLAGKYASLHLVKIYDEAIKCINYFSKYYGNNLKIVFLSSGYEPFIRGVVDGIIEKCNLQHLNYIVIGSQIKISYGIYSEEYHLNQFEKQKVLKNIIDIGGKIQFLADDSIQNEELFNIVKHHDGIAINIKHIPNKNSNETWKNFIDNITFENIKKNLMFNDSYIQLNKEFIKIPIFLQNLEKDTNKIGITHISSENFNIALKNLKNKILDNNNCQKFEKNIIKMIFQKNNDIYLRGKLYYNWLPQYIFIDDKCIIEKWKELQEILEQCLEIVNNNNLLNSDLDYYERAIIYMIIDHLLESILFILNLIEQNNLIDNHLVEEIYHKKIVYLIQDIMDFLFSFFYENKNDSLILKNISEKLINLKIINKIPNNIKLYKNMRELDDNITIFKFVKSIYDKIYKNDIHLDYIISFPYGGITLGFALKSYMKINGKQKLPELINCHYSSKQKIRKNTIEKDKDFSIFKYIPTVYNLFFSDILNGEKNILLLDNNVTTFKTLDITKSFLQQIGNNVYASVASINYNNILNYILNNKSEELVSNWRNVLDFNSISEYITSFNTWNTNEKSKILEEIYYIENQNIPIISAIEQSHSNNIFKICRVHNIIDLNTVIKNGANMIGIHAVYPDRIKYLKNEQKYNPIECSFTYKDELPIALLELDSIQEMQKYIPNHIKQAILFERQLNITDMIETCNLYKMPKESMYIQLQHRTNEQYIKNIKNKLCKNIIATIGLFQKDFKEYFWMLNSILDEKSDFILLDLSKHQPDLINYSDNYKESLDRVFILKDLVKQIKNNTVPIIIADDTSQEQMKKYLNILSDNNITVVGIDMQNIVELKTNEQKYQILKTTKNYQIKIRKSPDLMYEWRDFFEKRRKNE